ncbi:GYD domain-containing protein [Streptomyces sp. NPDC002926]
MDVPGIIFFDLQEPFLIPSMAGNRRKIRAKGQNQDGCERRRPMSKYLVKAKLTTEGLKGLLKEGGTARRDVVERMVQSVGGRLESMHWAFGDDDVYVTADLPNNASAAALGLVVSAAGGVRTSIVVLLTPEEIDEAVRQKVDYRAPGA